MTSRRKIVGVVVMVAAIFSVVVLAIVMAAGQPSRASGNRPHGSPPKVTFADGVTSGNTDLDQFVRKFVELCLNGDYDQYRLCWTAYAPPISGTRFRAMWDMAEHIAITQIEPVSNGKPDKPAYIVRASVTLNPKARIASKDVDVLVQWEDDRWAIAPAPRAEPRDLEPIAESAPASHPDDTTDQDN